LILYKEGWGEVRCEKIGRSGFTLVELVVAMGIMALLGGTLCVLLMNHMDMYIRQKARLDTQQKLRAVLAWMEDDIRMAGFDPAPSAGNRVGIEFAGSERFSFSHREEHSDGISGIWDEKDFKLLDYYINPKSSDGKPDYKIRREEKFFHKNASIRIILSEAELKFSYLDRHQNIIPNPQPEDYARIRAVRIELGASYQDRKGRKGGVSLTTTVKCRNLGIRS